MLAQERARHLPGGGLLAQPRLAYLQPLRGLGRGVEQRVRAHQFADQFAGQLVGGAVGGGTIRGRPVGIGVPRVVVGGVGVDDGAKT